MKSTLTNEFAKGVKEEKDRIAQWMKKQQLDDQQIEEFGKEIFATQDEKGLNIKTIFLAGWGRSGYVAEGFAMRLAHLKFNARYLTEPTAPPMKKDDLFIIVSGSGESFTGATQTALKIGAKVVMITSLPGSIGAKLADMRLIISGRGEEEEASLNFLERQMKGIPALPLGTAFELQSQVVLDSVITQIAIIKKKTNDDMKKEHSNVTKA